MKFFTDLFRSTSGKPSNMRFNSTFITVCIMLVWTQASIRGVPVSEMPQFVLAALLGVNGIKAFQTWIENRKANANTPSAPSNPPSVS